MQKHLNLLSRIFGIDVRSLALFRVALGGVLLLDLAVRATDLTAHYTDAGVLPRAALREKFPTIQGLIDVHLIGGSTATQAALFVLAAVFALALMAGYKTRVATVVSWVLLVSLQNRNTMLLHGGDVVLRLILFWAMFLPLGIRYSVDNLRREKEGGQKPKETASGRSAGKGKRAHKATDERGAAERPDSLAPDTGEGAVSAQNAPAPYPRILSFATAAALLQVCFVYWFSALFKSDPTWRQGTAVYYAFSFDQLVLPLGKALLAWPGLLRILTFLTLAVEGLGPCLALLPFWSGRIRTVMVLLFTGFHFSLGICLSLGIFPIVCAVAWLQFLPSEFWDGLQNWLSRTNPVWRHRIAGMHAAAVRGARKLPGWGKAAGASTPATAWRKAALWGNEGVVVLLLLYVFMWNLRSVDYNRIVRFFPKQVDVLGDVTRLDQVWNMFAPPPQTDDGWFVIPAKLANGVEIDLFRDGNAVTWEKPPLVVATSKNERWQKYMMNLTYSYNNEHRALFADYLRRDWDSRHGPADQIVSLQIFYMREPTLLDNKVGKIRKKYLGTYRFDTAVPQSGGWAQPVN